MASLQARQSHGHTYWYIVQSRRVNGKPRPITLAYLGKPADLLQRLRGEKPFSIRSYAHGDVRALLAVAEELQLVDCINQSVSSTQLRDGLTVGASLVLAALGRACHPTSKMGWASWAQETTLDYALDIQSKALTSQHFWDQMKALSADEISNVEERIVTRLIQAYDLKPEMLLLDYTNFFTFIDSGNSRCDLPRRGKNKQRRMDLRQLGLALLVTKKEQLPLFHTTYRGNKPDCIVFKEILGDLRKRLGLLSKELEDLTIVFDKGNNSKENLKELSSEVALHYVGSLTPAYHKPLIAEANANLTSVSIGEKSIPAYRKRVLVWDADRTLVVCVSEELKQGQIRGLKQTLKKRFEALDKLNRTLKNKTRKKRVPLSNQQLEAQILKMLEGQYVNEVVAWHVEQKAGQWQVAYAIDPEKWSDLIENHFGRRILMTDRHDWSTEEIILAYRSQTKVEYAFRNLKNPFHGTFQPSYHWTDQKLQVHAFICVIAYLMMMVTLLKVKRSTNYPHSVHRLMEQLKTIRLASLLEKKEGRGGRMKVDYRLEEISEEVKPLASALNITNENLRPNLTVGVYKSRNI